MNHDQMLLFSVLAKHEYRFLHKKHKANEGFLNKEDRLAIHCRQGLSQFVDFVLDVMGLKLTTEFDRPLELSIAKETPLVKNDNSKPFTTTNYRVT